MKYKNLFTPFQIGKCRIKNRFALAPMGSLGLGDCEGGWNQRGIDYYTRRAQGGTGLIITGVTFSDCKVEAQSLPNVPNSTYNPVQFVRTSREMTERVHAYNSKIFLMMSGGFGRVTIPTNLGEFPPVAPSAIPHRWLDKICRPLEKEEIHAIVESFGKGAYNAKRAGIRRSLERFRSAFSQISVMVILLNGFDCNNSSRTSRNTFLVISVFLDSFMQFFTLKFLETIKFIDSVGLPSDIIRKACQPYIHALSSPY